MFERLLEKEKQPTYEEFVNHMGECRKMFVGLNRDLLNCAGVVAKLDFPYGNCYGWGLKYYLKNKLLFIIFAEKDAFTTMIRLSGHDIGKLSGAGDLIKNHIDGKYPCGDGGWIYFRVSEADHYTDLLKIIGAKTGLLCGFGR